MWEVDELVNISLLFFSVFSLFCFMAPGYLLRKTKLVGDELAGVLSKITLYVAQAAMLLYGFITPFDAKVFRGICMTFLFAFVTHAVFSVLAFALYRKAPEKMCKVLQFGSIFSNAGYMGIPIISDVFGEEYIIYATVYVIWLNVFVFSIGRFIYTGDKSYISVKKLLINPAVIPIAIGLVIYVTGFGGWVKTTIAEPNFGGQLLATFYQIIASLKDLVAPISMMVVGARLADIRFGTVFRDKYLYYFLWVRLLLFPVIIWAILRVSIALGIIDNTVMCIVLILSATPSGVMTAMFAELYGGDATYAGKLVALSTICSVGSIPLVALLLGI